MKLLTLSFTFFALLLLSGCGEKRDGHTHGKDTEQSPNQALYDEVMDVHNEVMPKMDELYKAKTKLRARLDGSPPLKETEKQAIREKIVHLDSASESMMAWMRQFDPIPDSLGEERAKAYLENELVKVKEIRQHVLEALQDAEPDK